MKALHRFLLGAAALLWLAACSSDAPPESAEGTRSTESADIAAPAAPLAVWTDGGSAYTLIRSEKAASSSAAYEQTVRLRNAFREICGGAPRISEDYLAPDAAPPADAPEILIGETNRAESAAVRAALTGQSYAIRAVGQRIVIAATGDAMLVRAVDEFIARFLTSDGVWVPADTDILYTWDGLRVEHDPAHAPFSDGVLTVYPVPACYTVVDGVTVTVNGRRVPLIEGSREYDWCSFSLGGAADVSVTFDGPVAACTVSPLKRGYDVTVDGSTVSFHMDGAAFLILTADDRRRIILAADEPETDVPDPHGAGVYCVTLPPYGADPSGALDATGAIQRAVDDAFSAGGGTVYIPDGVYSITQLWMRSHVAWYLAPGAVLRLSEDLASLPEDYKRSSSDNALIGDVHGMPGHFMLTTDKTQQHEDIRLYGRGVIDARGNELIVEHRLATHLHPVAVNGFSMEGITLRESPHWSTMIISCENVALRGTKHLNETSNCASENDAIDIIGSSDVTLSNLLACSADDPISVKTYSTDAFLNTSERWMGTLVGLDCRRITVRGCLTWTLSSALKIGWGAHMETSDVLFADCVVYTAMTAMDITVTNGTGTVRGITYDGIDVEGLRARWTEMKPSRTSQLFMIRTRVDECGGIRDVTMKNINARVKGSAKSQLSGQAAGAPVEGVTFSHITLLGQPAGTLSAVVKPGRFTAGIRLADD